MWRSPGLELNDLGFLRQADRAMQWAWAGYRVNNPVAIFRNASINFNQWAGWNFGRESVFQGGNVNGGGQFKNYWSFWTGFGREGGGFSTSELRGGPALKGTGWWNQWYHLSSDDRKPYQLRFNGGHSWSDDGGSRHDRFSVGLNVRPVNAMRIEVQPSYRSSLRDLQYVETVENRAGQDRYIFGRLNQKTLGITFRFDYSITPDLSIQYYGQPFISSGSYTDFKSITESRAENYVDRFYRFGTDEARLIETEDGKELELVQDSAGTIDETIDHPDFSFREFRSNLVVRWEYRPGSSIFLVWTQERSGDDGNGRFSFSQGIDDLLGEDATNVFLVKVSRWFSL